LPFEYRKKSNLNKLLGIITATTLSCGRERDSTRHYNSNNTFICRERHVGWEFLQKESAKCRQIGKLSREYTNNRFRYSLFLPMPDNNRMEDKICATSTALSLYYRHNTTWQFFPTSVKHATLLPDEAYQIMRTNTCFNFNVLTKPIRPSVQLCRRKGYVSAETKEEIYPKWRRAWWESSHAVHDINLRVVPLSVVD
jgi:hypothetical protein